MEYHSENFLHVQQHHGLALLASNLPGKNLTWH